MREILKELLSDGGWKDAVTMLMAGLSFCLWTVLLSAMFG